MGDKPQQQSPQAADPQTKPARHLSWSSVAKSLVAGGIAGGVSRTAVAPLERLKILMQVQGSQKIYTGVWQGLVLMAQKEGVRGMFKGNWTNCVRIIPNSAVKFLTYEQLSRWIARQSQDRGGDGQMTPLLRLTAGAGAGIIAMSATYPLDMIRGRLTVQEAQNREYRGIIHCGTVVAREASLFLELQEMQQVLKRADNLEGIVALWRGWVPSVIGVVPYVGLNFAVYETLKDVVLQYYDLQTERELGVTTRLACGALAGTVGQTVAYPLDVVRRRMQMSGWNGAQQLHANQGKAIIYSGMFDCFAQTVRQEGFRALFKGLWPNYVKVVPSIAIAFVTYEQIKELLGVELRISS